MSIGAQPVHLADFLGREIGVRNADFLEPERASPRDDVVGKCGPIARADGRRCGNRVVHTR